MSQDELKAEAAAWKQKALQARRDRNDYQSLLEIAEDTLKASAGLGSILANAGLLELKAFRDSLDAAKNQEHEGEQC